MTRWIQHAVYSQCPVWSIQIQKFTVRHSVSQDIFQRKCYRYRRWHHIISYRRFWRARRSLSNMFKNTIRVNTFRPSTPRTMNSGGNSRVSTSTAICPALQPTSWEQSKTYISIALLNLPRWLNTVKGGETGLTSPLISTPSLPFHPMKGCRGLNHRLPAQQTRRLFNWANRVAFYLFRPVLRNSYPSFCCSPTYKHFLCQNSGAHLVYFVRHSRWEGGA